MENPYVGPRAFKKGEGKFFFGREQETLRLSRLLTAERIVLLFSPSGAGKTSLIQAALIPQMEEQQEEQKLNALSPSGTGRTSKIQAALKSHLEGQKFHVLPTVRVHRPPPSEAFNRYLYSAFYSLMGERDFSEKSFTDVVEGYIQEHPIKQRLKMLVFDQFEEILTVSPIDLRQKKEFFEEVGYLLADQEYWALFSMREDYVAALDPYLPQIPTRLNCTFRLDLLGEIAAKNAMLEPAKKVGMTFKEEDADELVNDLRQIKIQQLDAKWQEQAGPYIEPIQLQLVCDWLWKTGSKLTPPRMELSRTQEGSSLARDTVDQALKQYYAAEVKEAANRLKIGEAAIRQWFEEKLITPNQTRTLLQMGEARTGELINEALKIFEDAHLIRKEKRLNSTWYELSHDRLINPILEDNREWEPRNLSLLQIQARLWKKGNKPEDWNWLRGRNLKKAVRWAQMNTLDKTELEFLERSRLYARKRISKYLIRSILIVMLAMGLFYFSYLRTESLRSRSSRLALLAQDQKELDLAMLLGVEAYLNYDTPETRRALLKSVGSASPFLEFLWNDGRKDLNLTLSPVNNLLASFTAESDEIRIWNIDSPKNKPVSFPIPAAKIWAAVFSEDGRLLAAGTNKGRLVIWEVNSGKVIADKELGREVPVTDLIFVQDVLIASTTSGELKIWNLTTQALSTLSTEGKESITMMAVVPGTKILACASPRKRIFLWDLGTHQQLRSPLESQASIFDIVFSPDGQYLAAALGNDLAKAADRVMLWNMNDFSKNSIPLPAPVSVLAFSKKAIAIGTEDNQIVLWNPWNLSNIQTLRYHGSSITGLAFTADEELLASVSKTDGRIAVWNPWKDLLRSHPGTVSLGHTDTVTALAFVPKHKELVSGAKDGRIILWDLADGKSLEIGRYNLVVTDLCLTLDGELLVTSGKDESALSKIILWNMKTKKQIGGFELAGEVTQIAATPSGNTLITSGYDSSSAFSIKFWKLPEGRVLRTFNAEHVTDVAVSPDGSRAAAGTLSGKLFLWNVASGVQKELSSDAGQVTVIAFDSKSNQIASGSLDRDVQFWNLATNGILQSGSESRGVLSMNFDSLGSRLITGSQSGSIMVWEFGVKDSPLGPIEYGLRAETTTLSNLGSPVSTLAYSPGEKIVAYALGNSILVWKDDVKEMIRRGCTVANRPLTEVEWKFYIGGELRKGRWWSRYISDHESYHDVCGDVR